MNLAWAWRASKQADPALKMRLKFVASALREPSVSKVLKTAERSSPLGELLNECPDTVGLLLWPYQCAAWDVRTRLGRILGHFDVVGQIPGLKLGLDDKLVLADLSSWSTGTSLVLDRPPWLSREGHLALSLFKYDFRAFSISFSLFGYPETELYIGGLQGRRTDDILTLYRDLTKDFEGLRPRDFMLEMLRLFALKIGVRRVHAVADDKKISKHKYFGDKNAPQLCYDDVWQERGGARIADTHFELPVHGNRRSLDEVATKKRSMYRHRYEMLDAIEAALPSDLTTAAIRHFDAR